MTSEEKAKQQRFIVQNLQGIETKIKDLVGVKDKFRAKVNDLTLHGSEMYSPDYVEKELTRLAADLAAQMDAANTDVVRRLEELRGLIAERDAVLDLSNPALTNALALISTIGGGLSFDQAVKINANFVHDQSALRSLKAAYQAKGLTNAGAIDSLLYSADDVIDNLEDLAYKGLVQDGSINTFANALSKLAALEGLMTERMPDVQGAEAALRAAAGLPN